MRRGKKPFSEPQAELSVYIPESLALEVRLRLNDPLRGKIKYGQLSALVEMLLREWLFNTARSNA